MTRTAAMFDAVVKFFRTYPAMLAALANVIAILAAYFGFHVSAAQIAAFLPVVAIALGLVVHASVKPMVKVKAEAAEDNELHA